MPEATNTFIVPNTIPIIFGIRGQKNADINAAKANTTQMSSKIIVVLSISFFVFFWDIGCN